MEESGTAGQRDVEILSLQVGSSPRCLQLPLHRRAACAASPRSRDGQAGASSSRLAKRLQDAMHRRTVVQHDAISKAEHAALLARGHGYVRAFHGAAYTVRNVYRWLSGGRFLPRFGHGKQRIFHAQTTIFAARAVPRPQPITRTARLALPSGVGAIPFLFQCRLPARPLRACRQVHGAVREVPNGRQPTKMAQRRRL